MQGLELIVLLGATVFTGALLAPRVRMAAPLVLVIMGLLLGFVPALRSVELPPETVLLIFLPVMLFWESLTNDGTALVFYAIAVGLAVGGQYTPLQVTALVALSYVGGIAAGAVVAAIAYFVMRRLRDGLMINVALLITPFAAFLMAEIFGASGVLAVVVAGLIVSFTSASISTAASRRQTESVWPLGAYLLNGSLFVLIGLQVQAVAQGIAASDVGRLLVITVAVWATLLVVRFVFQTGSVMMIRLLDRRPSQRQRRMTYRARVVSAFAGFRGAVSLAIALAVPLTTSAGTALAGRNEILFVTGGVILLTLLVQGPLLPVIVRWARLPDDTARVEEQELAERAVTGAALAAVDDLAIEHRISDETRSRVTRYYFEHLELANARALERGEASAASAAAGPDAAQLGRSVEASDPEPSVVSAQSPLDREAETSRLRLAILGRKREVLVRLRRDGIVDDEVARSIQTRLDVEELRLTGVEPWE